MGTGPGRADSRIRTGSNRTACHQDRADAPQTGTGCGQAHGGAACPYDRGLYRNRTVTPMIRVRVSVNEEMIQHVICQYLSDRFGIADERLTGTARFQEDLGLDSLEMTEVLLSVEDEIGIDLGLSQLTTIDDVTSIGALTATVSRAAAGRSETRKP
jgi:acyl carrier protein